LTSPERGLNVFEASKGRQKTIGGIAASVLPGVSRKESS
jgi:hypothetical protein